jgi:hypothetical protein
VWDLVSELLTEPERLRVGLDAMVEQERSGVRGDPDDEARVWLERLAEADHMRAGYQELAAKGLMTIEELSARLEELEATRRTAADELESIRRRAERLEGLEHDRDALMEFYAGAVPEDLERLEPEERRRIYGMLRIEVSARPDGTLEVHGILGESLRVGSENGRAVCDLELAPWCTSNPANRPHWRSALRSWSPGGSLAPKGLRARHRRCLCRGQRLSFWLLPHPNR